MTLIVLPALGSLSLSVLFFFSQKTEKLILWLVSGHNVLNTLLQFFPDCSCWGSSCHSQEEEPGWALSSPQVIVSV